MMFPARRCAAVAVLAMAMAVPTLAAAPEEGYAVVVSRATRDDPRWEAVVRALVEAHAAEVLPYDSAVDEVLPRLRDLFPRYACFVARPGEAGRAFVARVHALVRRLDDDPYADARWGILTGRDAEDAVRIARHAEPLTIRRVVAGTEVALEMCEEGAWYSELRPRHMVEKRAGDVPRVRKAPADTTAALVAALNDGRVDLLSPPATPPSATGRSATATATASSAAATGRSSASTRMAGSSPSARPTPSSTWRWATA
jgi:hypothetical protein